MSRLFTDEQLRELERTPHQQLVDAVTSGDLDSVASTTSNLERSFIGTVVGTRNWVAHTFGWAAVEGPEGVTSELVDVTHDFYLRHPEPSDVGDESTSAVDEVVAAAGTGDADGAARAFDEMEAAWRRRQDFLRDWLCTLLSHIYRTRGLEPLEQALRYTAKQTLFDWMPVDMARPPEKRLPQWARMLQGHFSVLRITEDDEKFTLTQDPCGTCTRQIQQGRYAAPLDLAVIDEVAPATWFRGPTPIYRTHVPVWHIELARELVGVPWPVNQCPAGMGTGPCPTLLYKDPHDARANDQVPGPEQKDAT